MCIPLGITITDLIGGIIIITPVIGMTIMAIGVVATTMDIKL
jgi:hypothetical protein